MSAEGGRIGDLPHALRDAAGFEQRLGDRRPAVFLDYDGVLTPIVERPEDAVISPGMRTAVRALAERVPVSVVSGRDRPVVQDLMGVDDLVVAGSHGFDIWSPAEGTIQHEAASGYETLIEAVHARLDGEVGRLDGVTLEPKRASVAVHYRQASDADAHRVRATVDALLAERPDDVKVTPGKMVYELQPKLDWDKGKAVLHLLGALGLERDDVIPIYVGDDITDEHAFTALRGRGIGIFVGTADDPEIGGRMTAADYVLDSTEEVESFLERLAR